MLPFFRYSEKAVAKYGHDVACAYWLLRVGGSFRLVGIPQDIDSYWTFRKLRKSHSSGRLRLEEIDFSDSMCMASGFDYLNGLEHVKIVKLNFCSYIMDTAVLKLIHLEKSLQHVEIQVGTSVCTPPKQTSARVLGWGVQASSTARQRCAKISPPGK